MNPMNDEWYDRQMIGGRGQAVWMHMTYLMILAHVHTVGEYESWTRQLEEIRALPEP